MVYFKRAEFWHRTGFYNPYRLHSLLDYNSPMVFERIHALKTAHAR